jgi:ADP-heptose:LPS heptosyltransferase
MLVHVPFLHALRERHPGSRIVLFSPFADAELLVRIGVADEVRLYAKDIRQIARTLRAAQADVVYCLRPFSLRLDLAIGASGVPERAGYSSWLNAALFTRTVPHDTTIYRPRKYLTLLPGVDARAAALGDWFRTQAPAATLRPEAWGRSLGVLPGGGAGEFKLWGIENFLAACVAIAERDPDVQFVFVLGRQEAQHRARIEASPVARRSRCLIDEPVPALAAVAEQAIAAFGNDCGPGHLFQMCGCPYACIMANHDGTAGRRIAEWVDETNRPFAVTTRTAGDIKSIPVQAVVARVVQAMGLRD